MTTRFTTPELQTIFAFPFRDEKWPNKLGIALLIMFASILIVPGIFLAGYLYELQRGIIVDQKAPSLPEWNDFGKYFVDGLKMYGVWLVCAIPSLILFVPYILFTIVMLAFADAPSEVVEPLILLGMPISMLLMLLGMLVSFVMSFLSLAAVGHMIAQDEFGAAFRIRAWWPILRQNIAGYILAFVFVIGISWILSFVAQFLMMTIVLCVIAPFLSSAIYVYVGIIGSAMFAYAYRDGQSRVNHDPDTAVTRNRPGN